MTLFETVPDIVPFFLVPALYTLRMGVEFDEPGSLIPSRPHAERHDFSLTHMFVGTGIVKTEQGAGILMLVLSAALLALAAYIAFGLLQAPPAPNPLEHDLWPH